jgi:hypothetical protein
MVTVKYNKDPNHDPKNKVVGACPAAVDTESYCSDTTGEHHTVLVNCRDNVSPDMISKTFADKGIHVTRVEEVRHYEVIR